MSRFVVQTVKNKDFQLAAVIAVALLLLLNIALGFSYKNRTYPRTQVGTLSASNMTFEQLGRELNNLVDTRPVIGIYHNDKTAELLPEDIGLVVNAEQTISNVKSELSWLPIVNLVKTHRVQLAAYLGEDKFIEGVEKLKKTFNSPAVDAAVVFKDGKFFISEALTGYELNEDYLRTAVINAFVTNTRSFVAPLNTLQPKITSQQLAQPLKELEFKQQLDVRFSYSGKEHKVSAAEIGSWFTTDAERYSVNKTAVGQSVDKAARQLGMGFVVNREAAINAVVSTLNKDQKLNFGLLPPVVVVPPPIGASVTYTYCVRLKNVPGGALAEFAAKAAAVYADGRGWSLGGKVVFSRAESSCGFILWLSAADQMPSFGAICDSTYSCRVGVNVVINYNRWRYATDAWNGGGKSLDDYRSMVINHETGHWLGFGHLNCPGAGQLAPVMQQQSISLQGCQANPWPTTSERAALQSRL